MAQRSAAQEKPSHSHTDGWIRTILLNDELIPIHPLMDGAQRSVIPFTQMEKAQKSIHPDE
jgi:hypothetical protein